jgi:uncharacterized protein (TIGR02271 family)
METRRGVQEGMIVYSSDGEKLGKVLQCQAESFIIEKGFFFPKDYIARYEDVADVNGDEIHLSNRKEFFAGGRDMRAGETLGARSTTGGEPYARGHAGSEDVRVPVSEEQLDVAKRDRQTGEARLTKDVVTEEQRVDVPVMKERVHVERGPATEHTAAPGQQPFEGKTVSVPVHEEEVEIRKRPVVKEEVRLRKDREVEHRAVEDDVRKERIDIEGEGTERPLRDPDKEGL